MPAILTEPRRPVSAVIDQLCHATRRQRLFELLGGAAAVIPAAPLVTHHADCEWPFRQHSDFWYLTGFDEIIIMFDQDSAGKKAAQEVAEALPVGKSKIASLPYKDANDALVNGDAKAIITGIFQAKEYRPDGIVAATDFRDVIHEDDVQSSLSYPYSEIQELTLGIQPLTVLCAGSGVGKTTLVREIAYHLHQLGKRVGMIMLEESNKRTLLGLTGTHMNKNIAIDRSDTTDEEIRAAFDDLFGGENNPVYLYDHWGSCDPDIILNRIRFMFSSLTTDVVILDHLSILISSQVNPWREFQGAQERSRMKVRSIRGP